MFFSCREASLLLKTWITANNKTYGVDHVETLAAKRYHAVCLGKLGKDEEAACIPASHVTFLGSNISGFLMIKKYLYKCFALEVSHDHSMHAVKSIAGHGTTLAESRCSDFVTPNEVYFDIPRKHVQLRHGNKTETTTGN